MIDDELSWQQQAEIYQDALEAALTLNRELTWTNESQESQLQYFMREMPALRARHQTELQKRDDALQVLRTALHKRDQIIQEQQTELDHLRRILLVQQKLLRLRDRNPRQS